jgi:hypothetical protein
MISPIKTIFINGKRFATLTIDENLEKAHGKCWVRKYTDFTSVDIVLKQEHSIYNHFILLHEIYHGMIGMDGSWYAKVVQKARNVKMFDGEGWYPFVMFTEELMCDAFAYHNAGDTFIVGGSQMPEFIIKTAAKIFFSKEPKVKVEIV